jgi:sterol desaturase/sphingolipid hydroxylase (fatty acid hydroxylase superfamily)
MYFIYMARHPFFEQYRDNYNPWPWDENPAEWRKLKIQSVVTLSINFFLILPFTLYVSTLKTPAFDFSIVNWPSTFEIFWQFTFFLLTQDFFVYLSHRMFHLKSFYWIHKYHHEFRQSVCLAFSNLHPIEYLIGFFPTR